MKNISDKVSCRDVGDLISFINMLSINCPITPIEIQYRMDKKGNGSLSVALKGEADGRD